jgi:hypothetical protein
MTASATTTLAAPEAELPTLNRRIAAGEIDHRSALDSLLQRHPIRDSSGGGNTHVTTIGGAWGSDSGRSNDGWGDGAWVGAPPLLPRGVALEPSVPVLQQWQVETKQHDTQSALDVLMRNPGVGQAGAAALTQTAAAPQTLVSQTQTADAQNHEAATLTHMAPTQTAAVLTLAVPITGSGSSSPSGGEASVVVVDTVAEDDEEEVVFVGRLVREAKPVD